MINSARGSYFFELIVERIKWWIFCSLFVAPPDHEEEYQCSGSEEEDEQLLAGMIAEEMGWEPVKLEI